MVWTPLEAREPSLRERIESASVQTQSGLSAVDFYNQNDLGLLDPDSLLAWLNRGFPQAPESDSEDIEEEQPRTFSKSEAYDARSLRWLRLNGATSADRLYAKRRYRRLLFELWRKHIADTGQTYYPELRDDLMDRFEVICDQEEHENV